MTDSNPVVIVSARRTPMGGFQGALSGIKAGALGSVAIEGALEDAQMNPEKVDEVLMGCVLPAGQGQAPARQAAFGAGIPDRANATTINKMCGSGMKAVMFAHDLLLAGSAQAVIAGGMESMSLAPYVLPKARQGYRMGHNQVFDHMFIDGLEDAYEPGRLMGTYAEDTAESYGFTREEQDSYAIASLERANRAIENGRFAKEIRSVTVSSRKGDVMVDVDEQPGNARIDKIPALKPAFREGGTVTAANSSSISDGAAALLLMRRDEAEKRGLASRAVIHGHTSFGDQPSRFPTAPIGAMELLSQKTGWEFGDVDLFEINEAFAVVAMAAMRNLGLPHEKTNIHGGACALGHPIGASGARILVTLLHALESCDLKRGMAGICIGGGEATAIAIERVL